MYFNDVHIMYYVLIVLIGGLIGQLMDYCSKCFIKEEKIFSKKSAIEYQKTALPNYILIFSIATIYAGLLYSFGLNTHNLIKNIDLIKYLILIPMLACAFMVDIKKQIIPNRLTLLIFEIGLIFAFIYGFTNINITLDMLMGMLAGGGIFLIITLLRRFNCR
jgi:prepilin signal peptidase PulO-like enzyme (type II secretory pathway)